MYPSPRKCVDGAYLRYTEISPINPPKTGPLSNWSVFAPLIENQQPRPGPRVVPFEKTPVHLLGASFSLEIRPTPATNSLQLHPILAFSSHHLKGVPSSTASSPQPVFLPPVSIPIPLLCFFLLRLLVSES